MQVSWTHDGVVGAIGMLARNQLRRRWRGALVMTLLVGFVGGIVLATMAGAHSASSSLTRFERPVTRQIAARVRRIDYLGSRENSRIRPMADAVFVRTVRYEAAAGAATRGRAT
jgi:uncharacterized membrane protein YeaQ/YmgE (transglycosylase-associated protein family)